MVAWPGTTSRQSVGFTLVEVLIASVVLAVVAVALSQAIIAGQMQTADALHVMRATSLGEAMMEEVLAKAYPGTTGEPAEGQTGRLIKTHMNEYHNLSETAGSVTDAEGESYGRGYQLFARSVAVVAGVVSPSGFGEAISGVTITVTVQDQMGRSWVTSRFVPEPSS